MDGRFLTAFIVPEKWDILGYKLKPFSLRHMLYLTAVDSPFIAGGTPRSPAPEDILIFLRICSAEHPSKAFRSPTLMDRWRVVKLTLDGDYTMAAVKEILRYMDDCSTGPMVYQKTEVVEKSKEQVPSALSMAMNLMCRLNFPQEQAWDTPVGQAIWYLTAFSISEGSQVKILTTQEEYAAEQEKKALKRLEAEMLAKLKEQNGRK